MDVPLRVGLKHYYFHILNLIVSMDVPLRVGLKHTLRDTKLTTTFSMDVPLRVGLKP